MNYNQHQSRINHLNNRSNNQLGEEQSNGITNEAQSSIDRPVTRSLAKRNLQQQQEQQNASLSTTTATLDVNHTIASTAPTAFLDLTPTSSFESNDLTSNSTLTNNNNNEKILKLIQLRHQQMPTPPQKTYQKIIVNERPCNVINIFENSRLNGRMIRNISNVINEN